MKGRDKRINYSDPALGHHPVPDPLELFVHWVPKFVEEAREEAREYSYSHRGFGVGAVAVCTSIDGCDITFARGANTKVSPLRPKVCAEKKAIRRAAKQGLTPAALVVAGRNNLDQGSGLETPTLHSCEECRPLIIEHGGPHVLVMSVHLDRDEYELHTAQELHDMHERFRRGEPIKSPKSYTDPQFEKWQAHRYEYALNLNRWAREIGVAPVEVPIETRANLARAAIIGNIEAT